MNTKEDKVPSDKALHAMGFRPAAWHNVGRLFDILPHDIAERLVANIGRDAANEIEGTDAPHNIIAYLFTWSRSPEGGDFWSDVRDSVSEALDGKAPEVWPSIPTDTGAPLVAGPDAPPTRPLVPDFAVLAALVAGAPKDIPGWYRVDPRPLPPEPPPFPTDNEGAPIEEGTNAYRAGMQWKNDAHWDVWNDFPELESWAKAWESFWEERRTRDLNAKRERKLSWPLFWATEQARRIADHINTNTEPTLS